MAAVSPDEELMSEEHRQDRAQRALRVAVVTGFMENFHRVQESCLVLCNACREGVPLECRIGEGVPPTLLAMFLPHENQAQQTEAPPTRVLQFRRVQKVDLNLDDLFFSPGSGGVDVSKVQWPENTKEIRLLEFHRTVDDVTWPGSLDRLSFCVFDPNFYGTTRDKSAFNHPLSNAIFPTGLREIFLGKAFDQPIDDVAWPPGLERMSLPGFNQPIDDVRWPPALKSLEFMPPKQIQLRKNSNTRAKELKFDKCGHNCHFTNLPASLETFWLSDAFAQYLDGINWPPGLRTLGLGVGCEPCFTKNISWPSSLRHIYSMHEVDGTHEGCVVSTVKDYNSESQLRDIYEHHYYRPFSGFGSETSNDYNPYMW